MICTIGFAQNNPRRVAIIPEPVSLKSSDGFFVLPEEILLDASSNIELAQGVKLLTDRLTKATGKKVTAGPSQKCINAVNDWEYRPGQNGLPFKPVAANKKNPVNKI